MLLLQAADLYVFLNVPVEAVQQELGKLITTDYCETYISTVNKDLHLVSAISEG